MLFLLVVFMENAFALSLRLIREEKRVDSMLDKTFSKIKNWQNKRWLNNAWYEAHTWGKWTFQHLGCSLCDGLIVW